MLGGKPHSRCGSSVGKERMKMVRLRDLAFALRTPYWKPGDDFLERILEAVRGRVEDGDVVTVSEKAISTAMGNIVDEDGIKPRLSAKLIAKYWVRYVWGYLLGPACHLKSETIRRIRSYPAEEGSVHKEAALRYVGPIYALHWGSEGGMDASNLPYSYVALPLKNPEETARRVRRYIKDKLGKNVAVMIVDTDKTYSIGKSIHLSPRPSSVRGIRTFLGPLAYLMGRALKLKRRSTPIALAGIRMPADLALEIAETAHKLRGSGAGRTVWEMAERFGVSLTGVTWRMLERVEHKPIVIFKFSKRRLRVKGI